MRNLLKIDKKYVIISTKKKKKKKKKICSQNIPETLLIDDLGGLMWSVSIIDQY